jgi:hypothetical protein
MNTRQLGDLGPLGLLRHGKKSFSPYLASKLSMEWESGSKEV